MDLINTLLDFFKDPEEHTKGKTPEGICPVCWGYQEYDQKIRDALKDKQIDINNHQARYTLVKDFVVNHIDGIKLKHGEIHDCPTCGHGHEESHED